MTLNDVCKEAAKWWADIIRKAGKKAVSKKKVDKFEAELTKYIKKTLESEGAVRIECDYYPSDILTEIAKKCEVDEWIKYFPLKSFWNMTYCDDEVTIITKSGYGGMPFTTFTKLT